MSKTSTFARTCPDGSIARICPDGTEERLPVEPLAPMSAAAVGEAASRDPDARPLTESDVARMRRVPRAKTLRRALGLSQEEFAARYRIPIGTLRDWEQGRSEPDQPARAYLMVIARDPDGVLRALQGTPARAK
jgi:putative transcriptional regulator